MQIFSAEQIREWDEFTIHQEAIASINLMERAAERCFNWLQDSGYANRTFSVFCGKGSNGGDGLALARMLSQEGYPVAVSILEFGHKGTEDFQTNLALLHETAVEIRFIQMEVNFPPLGKTDVIIDALFGSGLNRPLEGVTASLVEYINLSGNEVIAIDIPSGLFTEKNSGKNTVVHATHTLSFQCHKLAFLLPENESFLGDIHILNIGLHPNYLLHAKCNYYFTDQGDIQQLLIHRNKFANKGDFGHALIVAGSYGKMGAAVLASRSCLRSGAGLLTVHIPKCGYEIMQISSIESMIITDDNENVNANITEDISKYAVIGIGPGIGTDYVTGSMIETIFSQYSKPVVVDADALNLLSGNQKLLSLLPVGSILTPHPKEFERLFGKSANDFDQVHLALQKAQQHHCVIVLKGHYTLIASPEGKGYFNSTGNAGMAKAGTGDTLTGIITGLLAQGYSPLNAARLGVYIHGLAGDFAKANFSEQSMLASDIIENLGRAFLFIQKK
jgi:ADP-dependent NAD(P)H-hydrate dehydratase / NAD(P)H-hydrate epimerase